MRGLPCPGDYSFTWDGTMNVEGVPPGTKAPKGIYTYDIQVEGACPYDVDKLRSESLDIQGCAISYDFSTGDEKYGFTQAYILSEEASEGAIEIYDHMDLEKRGALAITADEDLTKGAHSKPFTISGSILNKETRTWWFVVKMRDSAVDNKIHGPKWALDKGIVTDLPYADNYDHFYSNAAGAYQAAVFQRDVPNACQPGYISHSWFGGSTAKDAMRRAVKRDKVVWILGHGCPGAIWFTPY